MNCPARSPDHGMPCFRDAPHRGRHIARHPTEEGEHVIWEDEQQELRMDEWEDTEDE